MQTLSASLVDRRFGRRPHPSGRAVVPAPQREVIPVNLEDDDKISTAGAISHRRVGQVRSWDAVDILTAGIDDKLVVLRIGASRDIDESCVLGLPGKIVSMDRGITKLTNEVVGEAHGGGGIDIGDRDSGNWNSFCQILRFRGRWRRSGLTILPCVDGMCRRLMAAIAVFPGTLSTERDGGIEHHGTTYQNTSNVLFRSTMKT